MKPKKTYEALIAKIEQQHGPVLLEKKIMANGGTQVTAYANGHYIQHIPLNLIPADILNTIQISHDYRANNPPCAHCGAIGTELHHWAPQHLFTDAHLWPTAYLCEKCHKLWHSIIVNHRGPSYVKS